MQNTDIIIRRAKIDDLEVIKDLSVINKSHKIENYWELCRSRLENGELWAFLAVKEGDEEAVAYCFLNWKPKYRLYDQLNIPEIQDLNVLSDYRRQGIAKKLIRQCEERAVEKGRKEIGISFGLTSGYGYAQRLYTSLGYVPDGYGVTYDREIVSHGEVRPVDDDLCLMLVKPLSA